MKTLEIKSDSLKSFIQDTLVYSKSDDTGHATYMKECDQRSNGGFRPYFWMRDYIVLEKIGKLKGIDSIQMIFDNENFICDDEANLKSKIIEKTFLRTTWEYQLKKNKDSYLTFYLTDYKVECLINKKPKP